MKRSPMPGRRQPLGRGKPPTHREPPERAEGLPPIQRGKPPQRRQRLRPQSDKRIAERPERAAVREEALRRAGHRCQGADLVPHIGCAGPLDVDEIVGRGVRPGAHLEVDLTQVLCRAHHDWKHDHPADARAVGLTRKSWEA